VLRGWAANSSAALDVPSNSSTRSAASPKLLASSANSVGVSSFAASMRGAAAAQLVGASKDATHANATVEPRKPRIYFLFLAMHGVNNFEIWKAFFKTAPAEKYRAFIHCVHDDCKRSVVGSALQVVPTVPTVYCSDLVTAQQQLIRYALMDKDGAPNPDDKFAFISDSTLPAKSFSEIYGTLAARHSSDFCVFPVGLWKEFPWYLVHATVMEEGSRHSNVMMKHHQWIVLQREHAEKADREFSQDTIHELRHVPVCPDEFWYMFILYGSIRPPDFIYRHKDLEHFTGSPVVTSSPGETGIQGQCDTFAFWPQDQRSSGDHENFDLYDSLDEVSLPQPESPGRPGEWSAISLHGIRSIAHSPFLFVRKLVNNTMLAKEDKDGTMMSDDFTFEKAWLENVIS